MAVICCSFLVYISGNLSNFSSPRYSNNLSKEILISFEYLIYLSNMLLLYLMLYFHLSINKSKIGILSCNSSWSSIFIPLVVMERLPPFFLALSAKIAFFKRIFLKSFLWSFSLFIFASITL